MEMIQLLSGLKENIYRPRIYIVAETDKGSEEKVNLLEENRTDERQIPSV